MLRRILSGLWCPAFALGAWAQANDPDPMRWVVIYTGAALWCLLDAIGQDVRGAARLWGAACLVWSAVILFGSTATGPVVWDEVFDTGPMSSLRVEETREMLGLLIIAGWMAVIGLRRKPNFLQ